MRRVSREGSFASKRHRSTPVACSLKSAKLTPVPSQVAPKGEGPPGRGLVGGGGPPRGGGSGRGGTHLAFPRGEPDRAEGRQGEADRMRLAVPRERLAGDASAVADIAPPVNGAVAVEHLAVVAGLRHPDAVLVARHRR